PAVGDEGVKLTWAAAPDAVGYIIRRATNPVANPATDFVQLTGIRKETSYTDAAVAPGQTYTYHVLAINKEGLVSEPVEKVIAVPAK
ncbi:MAG: hypothetical protein M3347_17440, partial [Armatimonadota bacterium]|nr:hypothetical protein [Armatimonadota bacterium]